MATSYILLASALVGLGHAHVAAFAKGMYCENGTDPSNPNFNSNAPVAPLYNLTQDQWWFQHARGCDLVPPPPGVFLEIPAGGSFNVQLANNQAFTNLSYGGSYTSEWPDGGQHPEDWNGGGIGEGCIQDSGWIHTQNETSAQGTAFAISYKNDLNDITLEDLVIFSVLEHTPFRSAATYQVPAAMPACPEGGCTCSWHWVPRGCGQPNIYMQGFKCHVTGATSTTPLAKAQAPIMCDTDSSKCVQGAKQMIVWNQLTGNNVVTTGSQTPAYNLRNGFKPGAQDDIFEGAPSASPASSTTSASVMISSIPSAPAKVQSVSSSSRVPSPSTTLAPYMTTLSTVVKQAPASSSTSSSSTEAIPVVPVHPVGPETSPSSPTLSTSSAAGGSPVTVTVTVTASPTHSGHHYKDCWVDGEEIDS